MRNSDLHLSHRSNVISRFTVRAGRVFASLALSLKVAIGAVDPDFASPDPSLLGRAVRQLQALDDGVVVRLADTPYIVRFNTDGSLDSNFVIEPPLNRSPDTMAALEDGSLLIATETELIKLLPDGRRDPSFSLAVPFSRVWGIHVDHGIWITGDFVHPMTNAPTKLLRILSTGELDESFTGTVAHSILRLAADWPDAVYVSGRFGQHPETGRVRFIQRLQWNGDADTQFSPAADEEGYLFPDNMEEVIFDVWALAMSMDAERRLWVASRLRFPDGSTGMTVVNPEGTVSPLRWQRPFEPRVDALALLPNSGVGETVVTLLAGNFVGLEGRERPFAASVSWRKAGEEWAPTLEAAIDLRGFREGFGSMDYGTFDASGGPDPSCYLTLMTERGISLVRLKRHLGAPESPRGIRLSAVTGEAARISWDRASFAETVILERMVGDDDWRSVARGRFETKTAVATGLEPGRSYRFRLRGINSYGESFSAELPVNTWALPSAGALDPTFVVDLNSLELRSKGEVIGHQVMPGGGVAVATPNKVGLFDRYGEWTLTYRTQYSGHVMAADAMGRLLMGAGPSVTRFLPDGRRDTAFQPPALEPFDWLAAIAIQGRDILIGGNMTLDGSRGLVRLTENGMVDGEFHSPTTTPFPIVRALAVNPDQTMFVGGTFVEWLGSLRHGLVKLLPVGSVDHSFEPQHTELRGFDGVNGLLALPDGGVLASGFYRDGGTESILTLRKFESDGSLDPRFKDMNLVGGQISAMAVTRHGGWLVGGDFFGIQGTEKAKLAFLNADGAVNTDLNRIDYLGFSDRVFNITALGNGRGFVSGCFENYGNANQPGIALIHLGSDEKPSISFADWLDLNNLSSDSDPFVDGDADGLALWLEYVFDLNPLVKDSAPRLSWRSSGGRKEVNFGIVRKDRLAVVQVSRDLISWDNIEQPITDWIGLTAEDAFVRIRWTGP